MSVQSIRIFSGSLGSLGAFCSFKIALTCGQCCNTPWTVSFKLTQNAPIGPEGPENIKSEQWWSGRGEESQPVVFWFCGRFFLKKVFTHVTMAAMSDNQNHLN